MNKDYYVSFPLSTKCLALTTTVSLGNLAYQVDEGKSVKDNRLLFAKVIGVDLNRFVFVHQHHSDKIQRVFLNDLGKGVDSFEGGIDVDALYTYEKNVPLCIFHADCVPIFFVNERAGLAGIIHAGFKGTLKHIAFKAMQYVLEKEKLNAKDFRFYIGPYRMPQSFNVDENSKKEIIEAGFAQAINNEQFDNGLANIFDLNKLGIDNSQITVSGLDTLSDDRFFSAYQKTPVGRLVSLIMLK